MSNSYLVFTIDSGLMASIRANLTTVQQGQEETNTSAATAEQGEGRCILQQFGIHYLHVVSFLGGKIEGAVKL